MAESAPPFRVEHSRALLASVKELRQLAIDRGLSDDFDRALSLVVDKLQTAPLDWGDPSYGLAHLRMVVYQGLHAPLQVSYVVDADAKLVIIREVRALPGSKFA